MDEQRSVLRVATVAMLVAATACTSTTMIVSRPPGARLYLNGQPAGNTPYSMSDTKIVGSTTMVRLELPGYEPTNGMITRNEQFDAGACLGGVFLLFPFLWIEGYNPMHVFELRPAGGGPGPYTAPPGPPPDGWVPAPSYAPPAEAAPRPPIYTPPPAHP